MRSCLKVQQCIKKRAVTSLVVLGMGSEGSAPKNGEPAVGFSSKTMLQHTGRFRSRIFNYEECDNTGAYPYSPDLASADFYVLRRLKSALMGRRFCDATNIIKYAMEELKRLSQNVFQ